MSRQGIEPGCTDCEANTPAHHRDGCFTDDVVLRNRYARVNLCSSCKPKLYNLSFTAFLSLRFVPLPQRHCPFISDVLLVIVPTSDEIQNFKNRFSFVSNSLTTGSLILENPFAAVV